jgi:hypothetical protein
MTIFLDDKARHRLNLELLERLQIKKRHLKTFSEAYLGRAVSDSELDRMIDEWVCRGVIRASPSLVPFGDFLRDMLDDEL